MEKKEVEHLEEGCFYNRHKVICWFVAGLLSSINNNKGLPLSIYQIHLPPKYNT
ncbi:hypothetical protein C8N25_10667 [Algoriphagus antarcticus]|uniref:Uncharacterized protein n=1 Tax=Algoriphagus antarcticus TaxID=238540 RepID=A0A3E0DZT5_9BACT|nr:hypothetical protein C8N25_10667 [Algoriphagus antarcticus]